MKCTLLVIGKTDADYIKKGIDVYLSRLKFYLKTDLDIIPDLKNSKNLSEDQQKKKEGELILNKIDPTDFVVLLDENGKQFSSVKFSEFIQKLMLNSIKRMVFVVGGPYGFSDEIYQRANTKISLSLMTYSHQMVRMIFLEQLYRAMTIINNEPYHHQ